MKQFSDSDWLDDLWAGITAYYLTSLPILLGVLFGVDFPHSTDARSTAQPDLVSACIHYDALHYQQILREGYSYDPAKRSPVAFFPAYPLLSRWVGQVTGLSPEEAALLTAQVALIGTFVFLIRWLRLRWPEATAQQRGVVLAVFGLWPTGLFLRMPYSESLFVCGTLAALYGMARGWPLVALAAVTGFATAVRPVGVALTAAFLWYVLMQPGSQLRTKVIRVILLAPLACWGLLAYMGFQWLTFGTPLAFAQTQEHWNMRAPQERGWMTKLESLAMLEPIWGVYLPSSPRYWSNLRSPLGPLFNLFVWNPLLFVLAWGLLGWGGRKRWLTGSEVVLGACLLAIPYVTRGFEMSMASHGRFAAVVVVNYLVIGRMLSRAWPLAVAAICTALALFLFIFTFLYVKNFPIF